MSTESVDYFLRLNGRFGSSTVSAGAVGASPNAGGALSKSVAAGAGVGATGCAHVCSVV